ncbi:hypothetical protein RB595_005281 [Gaeumannomyces hyphopodioides]
MAGWTSSPTQRGTMQIIWSCLAVLFICSYKCIHLNIPSRDETESGWHSYRNVPYWPKRARRGMLLRKLKWMALILIAPDLGVGVAAINREEAKAKLREVNKDLSESWKRNTPFTLTHAHYAVMGGFVRQDGRPASLQEYKKLVVEETPAFSMTSKFPLFYRSEADLRALSKSDSVTKVLAIGQSLFLVLQCTARRANGLHYSLLELVTILYVICAAVMYGLWWEKPYDAHNATILPIEGEGKWYNVCGHRVENFTPKSAREIYASFGSSALLKHGVAAIFSGLHLLAWNWPFPEPHALVMQWFWRAASLASVAVPPLWCLSAWALREFGEKDSSAQDSFVVVAALAFPPLLYIICRLTIVGLVFYSVFSMPAGVYQTVPWTAYLPFLS